ncbi:MAG TPA: metalloregulator ArsR/SmtB family transcription factor [Myxococcales bacterium]|nr:metalloregulator ArsR/SmtB family transcription factor [Myxococcales bacterium]
MKVAAETDVVRILRALGDSRRFRMVQELAAAGELSCSQLGARFELSQPTISHHLKILVDAGLVTARQSGQRHFLSVNPDVLRQLAEALPVQLTPYPVRTRKRNSKQGRSTTGRRSA